MDDLDFALHLLDGYAETWPARVELASLRSELTSLRSELAAARAEIAELKRQLMTSDMVEQDEES